MNLVERSRGHSGRIDSSFKGFLMQTFLLILSFFAISHSLLDFRLSRERESCRWGNGLKFFLIVSFHDVAKSVDVIAQFSAKSLSIIPGIVKIPKFFVPDSFAFFQSHRQIVP